MVRNYSRKTERGAYGSDTLTEAVNEVKDRGTKLRVAARMYGVPKSTLERHLKVNLRQPNENVMGRSSVFGTDAENKLAQHLLDLESRGFGLTPLELRQLAYKYATSNDIPNNFNEEAQMAGYDWLQGFLKRHQELSLRKPEALSMGRASGMNKLKVGRYFDLLQDTLNQNDLMNKPDFIYNVDETGITEVHKPPKVIAGKGKRNVYSVTSGEKGTTTTAVCCVNASGDYIPPMLIFKGRRASPALEKGAPPGSLITLSDSGWINGDLFYDWMVHFNTHRKKNPNGKTLLIVDGHASHLTLKLMKYTQEQGIILLCLPSKCTHWLQPLDKSMYKPLKTNYDRECSLYMRDHAGERITRYAITELFTRAYLKAATMQNAISGFRACGMCPFNPQEIPECAFVAAETTDRAKATATSQIESVVIGHPVGLSEAGVPSQPDTLLTVDVNGTETARESPSTSDDTLQLEIHAGVHDVDEDQSEEEATNQPQTEEYGDIGSLMEMVGLQPESQPESQPNTAVDSIEAQTVQMTCSFSDIMPLPQAGPRASKKRKTVDGNAKRINSISNITELEAKSAQATKTKHKKAVLASKKAVVASKKVVASKAKTSS